VHNGERLSRGLSHGVKPAHRVAPQLVQPPGHRDAPTASGNLFDPFLEPPIRFVRPHHLASPQGEAPYYMMYEMYFDDMDTYQAALMSEDNKAAGQDLISFAKDIVLSLIHI